LTGIELAPEDANLDHIVPIARGGMHEMGNVQIVHRAINHMKSTLTPDEFLHWCRQVVAYADGRSVDVKQKELGS
jgi:5-methylcytosine-specific restriction endonuclease McrA